MKKQRPDKDNCFDMELMIQQLTTVVKEFRKCEFWNIADALREDWNTEIDNFIGTMICLIKTAQSN